MKNIKILVVASSILCAMLYNNVIAFAANVPSEKPSGSYSIEIGDDDTLVKTDMISTNSCKNKKD